MIAAGLAGIAFACTDVASATATTGTQNWSPDASATENISIVPLGQDGPTITIASALTTTSVKGINWKAASGQMMTQPAAASARSFFHTVYTTVTGARIRSWPVTGRIIHVVPDRGHSMLLICKRFWSDGYYWGFGHFGVYGSGWIRGDLWTDAAAGTNPSSVYDPTPVC